MDAGAVFFAVRDLHEGEQLDYGALVDLLGQKGFGNPQARARESLWVMWTSVVPHNQGQVRFLDYAERQLGWMVRRFSPADGYIVDPVAIGLGGDNRGVNRLLRFDSSISFAIGSMATDHRIAVISDSFAVAEPLVRAAKLSGATNTIAFFGRLLDARWQRILRSGQDLGVDFVDLDEHDSDLFGNKKPQEQTAWTDNFLLK